MKFLIFCVIIGILNFIGIGPHFDSDQPSEAIAALKQPWKALTYLYILITFIGYATFIIGIIYFIFFYEPIVVNTIESTTVNTMDLCD